MSSEQKKAILVLSDGKFFCGEAFGSIKTADQPAIAEVVFNTSMSGYQEIISDPSYAGQMLCFTVTHIGNVGCNKNDDESSKAQATAVIVRDHCKEPSNYRSEETLDQYLSRQGVMGISGIDTRCLVRHLRDNGSQMGALAYASDSDIPKLQNAAQEAGSMLGKSFVDQVTCKKPYSWKQLPWDAKQNKFPEVNEDDLSKRDHVVVLDCGVKYNILRLLTQSGFRVTVVPAYTKAKEILALNPKALFLSNGPGDPATLGEIVTEVKELFGKIPMFGICLGHQIMAQALGAKTYKLDFGHRGGNHPVRDEVTKKIEITVQNHGFAVDAQSFGQKSLISHINLNDQTIEGLDLPELFSFCVQYHPESAPGPHDAEYLFNRFYQNVMRFHA